MSSEEPIQEPSDVPRETKKIKLEDPVVSKSTTNSPPVSDAKEPPVHEVVGGSSMRQYLNKHLTQHLLEGLQEVSKEKPEDPLRKLGEFLIKRADELNTSGSS